ncbi:MAG: glycosyltransferase [Proteobacteria bacterium]|nr:glycosyltransferase [Pseudomonadota bacterium]
MADKTLEQLYAEHEGKVSDKWSIYLFEYNRILSEYRHLPVRMLEIGVQNGGSLDIWLKYFANAQKIIGCDINSDCGRLSYQDSRIALVVGDANSDSAQAQIAALSRELDLIIDDGSHLSRDIVNSFARYFPLLADGGLFVVEDLHCSYWREFEGGLYHPYSSITFFKRLADVIGHEHWGVDKAPGDILRGFNSEYGFRMHEDDLNRIHSIEFINSMCVIRKAPPERNRLGKRVIAGSVEMVVPEVLSFNNAESCIGAPIDQRSNEWTTRSMPPSEELLLLLKEMAELKTGLASTERALWAVLHSSSWKITKPLRSIANQLQRIKNSPQGLSTSKKKKQPADTFALTKKIRQKIISAGHVFYRQRLKQTRFGPVTGKALIKLGLITPEELQNSDLLNFGFDAMGQANQDIQDAYIKAEAGVPGLHLSQPLNLDLSPRHALRPHINVLLPSLRLKHMSGGPNTALLLAGNLVTNGEWVRLIACDAPAVGEKSELYPHIEGLFGRRIDRERIALVDGTDRSKPVVIGANDLFMATAWWTAQVAKYAVRQTNHEQFIYLIQDFEPILHEGSTFQAKALETYGLPHIPIINTKLLLDHLVKEGCGCYAQPAFAQDALTFDPAIDRQRYFPDPGKAQDRVNRKKRTLLFYARPNSGRRNLFEIGLFALRRAVAAGFLDKEGWEIWGMGENFTPINLGKGVFLKPLAWMDLDAYAQRVRTADLLLSLMLSPHPSYPPLEMAASGKLAVTNSFSVKTAERLHELSPNIMVAEPNSDSVADVLEKAVGRINAGFASYDPTGAVNLPADWNQSLAGLIPKLRQRIDLLRSRPSRRVQIKSQGLPAKPQSDYERFRKQRLGARRRDGRYWQEPGLLSFVTSAYDTEPQYLADLASSLFMQDGGANFEWLILDNGSTRPETREALNDIAKNPCVRLQRVDANLGIIGGMRHCLERATGRYILPLDSDDLVEPDCVHVITRTLHEAGYPPLLYTDEDKLTGKQFIQPYFKPDWDPVLFAHSCYIAHLCAIDRQKGLELGLYKDAGAEGCHDWDSFFRFIMAGDTPVHVPEVLYSWRMHDQSTAENIDSKSFISDSHRTVLQRFLEHADAPQLELVYSRFFNKSVDWWFRRRRNSPAPSLSVAIGGNPAGLRGDESQRQKVVSIKPEEGVTRLAEIVNQSDAELVHLIWDGVRPDDDEWLWDAMGLLELFPDAAMVGGALHDGDEVIGGPAIFGFGQGFDCPDRGRTLSDPGYFAQMWKPHSVSAVSSGHCVVRGDFLKSVLSQLAEEKAPLNMLGPWLGGLAREAGQRVVFSPFMSASAQKTPEDTAAPDARAGFLSRFWRLLPEEHLLSPRLGLEAGTSYAPVSQAQRERHLAGLQQGALEYKDWFDREIIRRAGRYPMPRDPASISILTAVYEKSDLALLDDLAESIVNQTLSPAQWVIVVNGPVTEGHLEHIGAKSQDEWGATLIVETQSLGIIGALRRGLESAVGQYVVPVDADDLLTPDAIQILAREIQRLNEPDMIFSDEDLLAQGKPAAPYLRSVFDPVLNLDSSYIWHLLAIKRSSALERELYSDPGANWCQDWDSVTRIANAGGRIEHCPEILYHWRQHSGSTTNKPEGDPRSLDSVRHVLQGQIDRAANPELYAIETWPIDRGAKELYISRPEIDLSEFVWIGDYMAGGEHEGPPRGEFIVANAGSASMEAGGVFNEAARLFGLHPHIGAVGGRIIDENGLVVESCFVNNGAGGVESPWMGRGETYPGPYALALKAQSVISTGPSLAFFRLRALEEVGVQPPEDLSSLCAWVLDTCERLVAAQWGVVFSPLVVARSTSPWPPISQADRRPRQNINGGSSALSRYGLHCPYVFK